MAMATANIRLRADQLGKYRGVAGIKTDDALARRMGMDPASVSRVLRGTAAPGPKFIGALVGAFPGLSIDDLFEVVPAEAEVA